MPKDKMTVTLDPGVLADTDRDAAESKLNRSEYVERVLRDAHYRRLLSKASPPPAISPAEEKGLRSLLDWQRNPDQAA